MSQDGLQRLLDFAQSLRERRLPFRIEKQSEDALMLTFKVGSECVEVDFHQRGIWFSKFALSETGQLVPAVLERIKAEHWSD